MKNATQIEIEGVWIIFNGHFHHNANGNMKINFDEKHIINIIDKPILDLKKSCDFNGVDYLIACTTS